MVHISRRDAHAKESGSESEASNRSGSRSGSSRSQSRSGSAASKRSRSASGSRSGSGSARSGSAASGKRSGSGSGSPGSKRASRSRSRSGSASNRSRSRSGSGSRKSRSRSGSARSRSGSKSGSGSDRGARKSQERSRSRSGTPRKASGSDSGSDIVTKRKQKKQRKSSDAEKPEVADIFGEDLGDISDDDDDDDEEEKDNEPEREIRRMGDLDEDDEENADEPQQQLPETRIDVEVPRIRTDLGDELHFVKLPNFLSVETRPYDPETYEDEVDDDEAIDEEGRARLKLKVENTIRWRTNYDKDTGDPIKQSNARIVRWSDGSMSLHLGSEIFDVHKQSLMTGDHNHLFIRQGTGLQGQAVFRTKLSFRPHSTDSFTHRKMTLSLAGRSQKANKVRVLPTVGLDPEKNRNEMLKKEEEKLRAFMRRDNKQRRIRDRAKGMNAAYLEDDEDGVSLNAIKHNAKNRPSASNIYSSDTDDSDIEGIRRRRASDKPKKIQDSDEEEEDYFDKKAREGNKSKQSGSDSDKKSAKSASSDSGE